MLAGYPNPGRECGRGVAVTYKHHDLVPGSAVVDLELGRYGELSYRDWLTDTSVDDQGGAVLCSGCGLLAGECWRTTWWTT
jgi:hypothetical protein